MSRMMDMIRYQVCPKCGFNEAQGRRWERRRQVYRYFWRNEQCPECNETLVRQCPNCEADLLAPDGEECPECNQAYPWSDK